jgi:hypothetical protein
VYPNEKSRQSIFLVPVTYFVNIIIVEQIKGILKEHNTGTITGRGSYGSAFNEAASKRFDSDINVAAESIHAIPAMWYLSRRF